MIKNTIGRNIQVLRKSRKMTQEQLAGKLYMKRQTLSNYEIGRRVPDIYELMEIANVFEMTLDEIVGRTFTERISTESTFTQGIFAENI